MAPDTITPPAEVLQSFELKLDNKELRGQLYPVEDSRGVVHKPIHLHCGTPQHTPYPAKGPVLPRGPGRSPGRKFWPLNVICTQKTRAPLTYSTLLESSRRDLRDSGAHTGL